MENLVIKRFRSSLLIFIVCDVFIYSPKTSASTTIITSNLALYLDPSDNSSYSGSGSTIFDLSGNSRNGTIEGTPLPNYENSAIKSFVFERFTVDDTASTKGKIRVNGNFLTDEFTIQTWIKTNLVGRFKPHYTTMFIVAAECGGVSNDWGLGIDDSGKLAFGAGPNDVTIATDEQVDTDTWTNVAVSRSMLDGRVKLYINGVLKKSGISNAGNSLTCSQDNNTWIGNGQDGPAYSFGGRIGSVLGYTAVLSDLNIQQNFEATSSKYGFASTPNSPNLNSVSAGDKRLTVAFTAGSDGGSAITDYEYSLNGGSYISAGTTSSPFTITGLNGRTSYSVTLKARNSVGLGTASSTLSATTTDAALDDSEAAAERQRVANEQAAAAKRAKEQKELTELLSLIPSIAELALNIGKATKSINQSKCVKGKTVRFVKKGKPCPKGFARAR